MKLTGTKITLEAKPVRGVVSAGNGRTESVGSPGPSPQTGHHQGKASKCSFSRRFTELVGEPPSAFIVNATSEPDEGNSR